MHYFLSYQRMELEYVYCERETKRTRPSSPMRHNKLMRVGAAIEVTSVRLLSFIVGSVYKQNVLSLDERGLQHDTISHTIAINPINSPLATKTWAAMESLHCSLDSLP